MAEAQIVPATMEMIRSLHADLPKTVRAIAAVEGERVLGVAALYPQEGCLVLCGVVAPETRAEMKRHRRTLLRCVWTALAIAVRRGMPVVAMADQDIEGSDRLLLHLGFMPKNGNYQWESR